MMIGKRLIARCGGQDICGEVISYHGGWRKFKVKWEDNSISHYSNEEILEFLDEEKSVNEVSEEQKSEKEDS